MIVGFLGLMLNLLTVGVISFVVASFIVTALSRHLRKPLTPFNAIARRRLLWGVVALPWAASVISIALLILPELSQRQENWLSSSITHYHHVYEFNFASWHGISLLMFCVFFLFHISRKFLKAVTLSMDLHQLEYFSDVDGEEKPVCVLRADIPLAFTSGLLQPRVYMTSGLIDRLTDQECDIVVRHELAHAGRFDPLLKYLFSLFSAFFPRDVERRLNCTMALAIEQCADEAVLKQIPDDALISTTILKVVRLYNAYSVSLAPATIHCHFIGDQLQQRIHYLLDEEKGKSFPVSTFSLLALGLVAASCLSVDLVHHAVERVFTH
jgi:beta-lactamase regulating signal transducer with metallopeptidase domain